MLLVRFVEQFIIDHPSMPIVPDLPDTPPVRRNLGADNPAGGPKSIFGAPAGSVSDSSAGRLATVVRQFRR